MTTKIASPSSYLLNVYYGYHLCSAVPFDLACQIALNMTHLFFQAVEDAFVPVIKFKFDGIEVKGVLDVQMVSISTLCEMGIPSEWIFTNPNL